MKIKTSELIGAQLHWAVSVCEGYRPVYTNGSLRPIFRKGEAVLPTWGDYSTDWAQGGPIIERAFIHWGMTAKKHGETPTLYLAYQYQKGVAPMKGSTPLIAAMRCYVASKLGDEVEVPDNLT